MSIKTEEVRYCDICGCVVKSVKGGNGRYEIALQYSHVGDREPASAQTSFLNYLFGLEDLCYTCAANIWGFAYRILEKTLPTVVDYEKEKAEATKGLLSQIGCLQYHCSGVEEEPSKFEALLERIKGALDEH